MASPQTGIFALGTSSHAWLEFDLEPSVDPRRPSRPWPRCASRGRRSAGSTSWPGSGRRCGPPPRPTRPRRDARDFDRPVTGPDGYAMAATQHDAVIWLTGSGYDVVFDLSRAVASALAGKLRLAHEMVGWPYHHDLDLTGFMDGTENPSIVEATSEVLVPAGDPGEGGSILLLQQWEHDAASWEALPTDRQEAAIGRRKTDSVELDPRPASSHVARTDQDSFGRIFRRNIAYGSLDDARDGLRGLQRPPGDPGGDARQHGRPRRAPRRADAVDPGADRRVLRDPVSGAAGGVRHPARGGVRDVPASEIGYLHAASGPRSEPADLRRELT